jgi:hypothetical protein
VSARYHSVGFSTFPVLFSVRTEGVFSVDVDVVHRTDGTTLRYRGLDPVADDYLIEHVVSIIQNPDLWHPQIS